ncbi:MAG: glycosyltransferase family 4 protein, partial [Actinobacteria bacterium]|nr:glycosyltransferase family 4 protein [Actinomycetota bacterium]
MKICRVTPIIYPYFVGGLSIHCHELSNHQSKDGHQVTVLTVKRGYEVEEVNCYYNLKRFRWFKMPWDFLNMENPVCPGLWLELLKSDFDLLHVHSHLFFTSLFSVIISKIKGKPAVITVHGVRAVRDKATNLLQEVWIRIFSRLIFRMVEKVFCQTQADAEEIKKYGLENKKIEIIPNGIDTELFSQCSYDNGYILWVGRFVKEKGLEFLVEAIDDIKESFPDKQVVLVGYGPLKQEIMDNIIKKGLK